MAEKSMLDMIVEKMEFNKDMQNLEMDTQLNKAKMLQKVQKRKQEMEQQAMEMRASGQLRFQSSNPDDGYNYPLIDVIGNISK